MVAKEFVGRTLQRTNVKGIWVYAQPLAPTWIRLPNMGRVRILLGAVDHRLQCARPVHCVSGKQTEEAIRWRCFAVSSLGVEITLSLHLLDAAIIQKVIRPGRMSHSRCFFGATI